MLIVFRHPALSKPLRLEGKMEVCGCCQGLGRTFRSDLDENRLVELLEADGDEDGLEDYRRGHFDQRCPECQGANVVQQIDWEAFEKKYPKEAKKINSYERSKAADEAYSRSERAFCGY